MIIQCRQCRTKFYFDDTLMQNEGMWMRCSRCQHVFFQENPLIIKQEQDSESVPESIFSQESQPLKKSYDLTREVPSVSERDEDVVRFLDNVMEVKKNLNEKVNLEMEKTTREVIGKERFVTADRSVVFIDSKEKSEEAEQKKPLSRKSSRKTWKAIVWAVLVIVAIPVTIYFFIFPELGDRFVRIVNKYISEQEPVRPEIVIGQVKLQDIRQRILNNYVLGQIRVMEGTAVNQADYPISRIVIKGAIVDAFAVVLGERTTYAGNVLTDDELINLAEEEILKRLSRPEGNNNSNDKIVPNGQIPFMIVFIREPAGVIKTTVTTIGAERLL